MCAIDISKSLLIVDDQITNLTLLSRFLSEYQVYTVDGGAIAIEKALELLPDLILLDINMPDIDGYQVCETLKKSSATADIPIIFITGLSDPGQINKGFEVGAIDYITKPFSLSEVRARVRNSLALKSASEALINKNILLENIIREQSISSALARQVLRFVNPDPARYIDLGRDLCLFVHTISQPCYEEGGDHSFVRTLASSDSISPRTVLSIKDQSGHSVNCILRSIATDLAHNGIIKNTPEMSVAETVSHLNHAVLQGGIFAEDDFLAPRCFKWVTRN